MQQATQRRQHFQISLSQNTPKQAQDKRLREEEKKVITFKKKNVDESYSFFVMYHHTLFFFFQSYATENKIKSNQI